MGESSGHSGPWTLEQPTPSALPTLIPNHVQVGSFPALLTHPWYSLTCSQKSSVSSEGCCGSRGCEGSPERVRTAGFTLPRASTSLAWLQDDTQGTWAE